MHAMKSKVFYSGKVLLNAPVNASYQAPAGLVNCRWRQSEQKGKKLRGEGMWMPFNHQGREYKGGVAAKMEMVFEKIKFPTISVMGNGHCRHLCSWP